MPTSGASHASVWPARPHYPRYRSDVTRSRREDPANRSTAKACRRCLMAKGNGHRRFSRRRSGRQTDVRARRHINLHPRRQGPARQAAALRRRLHPQIQSPQILPCLWRQALAGYFKPSACRRPNFICREIGQLLASQAPPLYPAPDRANEALRRGGRVVECVALEMRSTGNCTGGSNPSLSATNHCK